MNYIVIVLAMLASTLGFGASLEYATSEQISSKALSEERTFYVKLPSSYPTEVAMKYPVLYVLHGQWDMLPAVATIDLLADEIPEFVIVGVDVSGWELRPTNPKESKYETPFFQLLVR